MPASNHSAQLELLEKRISKAIEELASSYPFLLADMARAKKENDPASEKNPAELALDTIREIRESLAA